VNSDNGDTCRAARGALNVAVEDQIWNVQCWMVSGGAAARATTLQVGPSSQRCWTQDAVRNQVVGGSKAAGTLGAEA
jgi:hypothetical protein